jgi:hypothetical protein
MLKLTKHHFQLCIAQMGKDLCVDELRLSTHKSLLKAIVRTVFLLNSAKFARSANFARLAVVVHEAHHNSVSKKVSEVLLKNTRKK